MLNEFAELRIQSNCCARLTALVCSQPLRPILKDLGILTTSSQGSVLDQAGPNEQVHRNVLASRNSFFQISAPRLEVVDPPLCCVTISTQLRYRKLATPAIIAEGAHGRGLQFMPVLPVQNLTCNLVVAIGEDVRFHDYGFTYNALDGESPTVNLGRKASNYDAMSSVHGWFQHLPAGFLMIGGQNIQSCMRQGRRLTIRRFILSDAIRDLPQDVDICRCVQRRRRRRGRGK